MANSKKNKHTALLSVFVLLFVSSTIFGSGLDSVTNKDKNSTRTFFSSQDDDDSRQYQTMIERYLKDLKEKKADSLSLLKKIAFSYAEINQPELAVEYIEKYVMGSQDVAFVGHSFFDKISHSESYIALADKYLKKITPWAIFCFYVAFIGFFISLVLNFRERSDKIANLLMSVFILTHSVFIIHIGLYFSNYQYYVPHILYMSTLFSFSYGPLIYFYFKRVTIKYSFKSIDILHLMPSILLMILLFPIYSLSTEEKLGIILNEERPYLNLISIFKLLSLLIYGGLVIKMYLSSIKTNKAISKILSNWQRNIVIFCSIYIISYSTYSILIIKHVFSGFLFYTQVVSMALLVLYVGYTAVVRPSIFGNLKVIKPEFKNKPAQSKYVKSGLTESLSLELKEKLLRLLNEEKIYKQNDITLQALSELMETTRHNASQIINEHFNLNFFELINKYRIEEAKELLREERHKNFNIIDIAYEVGFNNKVTFNKSFKKYNQITPSEYVKSLVA